MYCAGVKMLILACVISCCTKQVHRIIEFANLDFKVTVSNRRREPPDYVWCHIKNNRKLPVSIVRNASGMNGFSVTDFSSLSKKTKIAREPEAPSFTKYDVILLQPGLAYSYRISFSDLFVSDGSSDRITFKLVYHVRGLFSKSTPESSKAEQIYLRSKSLVIKW